MPTLFRFIFFAAVLTGMVYAGMIALVAFVEPTPREMSIRIPKAKFQNTDPALEE
ncbi:MAG: histidine kinase [Hyphomicrobiales bacterium]|nr:histidine kinase [Hyphomicrobiales bacterium]